MSHTSMGFEGGAQETPGERNAKILRSEVMFGNIRIRCPADFTEHEIPAGTKEFTCPVDGTKLIILDV